MQRPKLLAVLKDISPSPVQQTSSKVRSTSGLPLALFVSATVTGCFSLLEESLLELVSTANTYPRDSVLSECKEWISLESTLEPLELRLELTLEFLELRLELMLEFLEPMLELLERLEFPILRESLTWSKRT